MRLLAVPPNWSPGRAFPQELRAVRLRAELLSIVINMECSPVGRRACNVPPAAPMRQLE